jgi:hypothetical protein
MRADTRHRLNAEVVTAKVIDGEAIVINVVVGRYYSLEGASGIAWVLLAGGATPSETGAALAERYDVDLAAATADAERLLEELLAEELVLPAPAVAAAPALDSPLGVSESDAPLRLETFRDMEDLLAFDPPLPAIDGSVWEPSES